MKVRSKSQKISLVAFQCCLLFSTPNIYAEELKVAVTEALGQAGEVVITSRDIQLGHFIETFLTQYSEKSKIIKFKALEGETPEFSQALGQSLLELVVQMEAENFSVGPVNNQEKEELMTKFIEATKNQFSYAQFEFSQKEVDLIFYRKLRSRNFLKFKTETTGVNVGDEEIQQYFNKNSVKFSGISLSQVKENIRDLLSRQFVEAKLKDWFDILKRKYRVHFLGRAKNS